ncbi:MAG: hypothetical protein N2383_15925, partial [Caldilineales bacterium]|nr:hypothetical protein [Caldilineales bacterium]
LKEGARSLTPLVAVQMAASSGAHLTKYSNITDLATAQKKLIVDEAIPAAQVEALIRQAGGELLVDVHLFDLYRGKPIPPGKKSLAFALTYQSPTKTLTDADTARLRQRIVSRLEREIGAVLRAG